MVCSKCKRMQHFHCASIKDDSERQMYLTGTETFSCNICLASGPVAVKPSISTAQDINRSIEESSNINENCSNVVHSAVGNRTSSQENVVATQATENENTTSVCQTTGQDTQENHSEVTIRRLQSEITRLTAVYTEKETRLLTENGTLKESLRQSLALVEKERETKEVL